MDKCQACVLASRIYRGKQSIPHKDLLSQLEDMPTPAELGIAFLLKQNCTCKKEDGE